MLLLVVAFAVYLLVKQGGVNPLDPPSPPPIPGAGFRVLILEETTERTKSTAAVLAGTRWREYVKSKSGEWRIFDDDIPDAEWKFAKEPWISAFKRAKEDSHGKVPWLLVSNGVDRGSSMPLPATEDDLLSKLKEVEGDK